MVTRKVKKRATRDEPRGPFRIVPALGPGQFGPAVATYEELPLAENDVNSSETGRAKKYPNAAWAILDGNGAVVWLADPTIVAKCRLIRERLPNYRRTFYAHVWAGKTRNEAMDLLYEQVINLPATEETEETEKTGA